MIFLYAFIILSALIGLAWTLYQARCDLQANKRWQQHKEQWLKEQKGKQS